MSRLECGACNITKETPLIFLRQNLRNARRSNVAHNLEIRATAYNEKLHRGEKGETIRNLLARKWRETGRESGLWMEGDKDNKVKGSACGVEARSWSQSNNRRPYGYKTRVRVRAELLNIALFGNIDKLEFEHFTVFVDVFFFFFNF